MKFSDLQACPFCHGDEYYEEYRVHGTVRHYSEYDGEFESLSNADMYDSLESTVSGKIYCADCHKYLGNYITDTIGKAAEKKLATKK